jgi:RNA recognition motif-containing protein
MNIFVSNLSYKATDEDLRKCFEQFGTVSSAKIIRDKFNNRSRGFGFVEMTNDDEGNAAIQQLNGSTFQDRPLVVNISTPREGDGGGNRRSFDKPRNFNKGYDH